MDRNDTMETLNFNEEEKNALKSIRISRVVWPILIGLFVIGYLLWKQFNIEQFQKIEWDVYAFTGIILALLILAVKHLSYALRLYILSEGGFSFLKCVQLIFIWEFSSTIAPTAVGGSAVALFALAQEKLPSAKTTVIVIYTAILDSYFFVFTIPILLFIFGPNMIRPELNEMNILDGWGYTLLTAYIFKTIYSTLFLFGLFYNPSQIKKLLLFFTTLPFLKKWKSQANQFGDDIINASKEIKGKSFKYHFTASLTTFSAWICRFLILVILISTIIGLHESTFYNYSKLFARVETMFLIMMFSPTPGGSGFVELVFGGFLKDYVPTGISLIIATIWRIITYYFYIIAGIIIVPNWINKIILDRKKNISK